MSLRIKSEDDLSAFPKGSCTQGDSPGGTDGPPRTCCSGCRQIIPLVEDESTRAFVSVPLDSQIFPRTIPDVLESLKCREGIFDEETGILGHPLFATRPEKRALLVTGATPMGW